jgi:hypothetical protein
MQGGGTGDAWDPDFAPPRSPRDVLNAGDVPEVPRRRSAKLKNIVISSVERETLSGRTSPVSPGISKGLFCI